MSLRSREPEGGRAIIIMMNPCFAIQGWIHSHSGIVRWFRFQFSWIHSHSGIVSVCWFGGRSPAWIVPRLAGGPMFLIVLLVWLLVAGASVVANALRLHDLHTSTPGVEDPNGSISASFDVDFIIPWSGPSCSNGPRDHSTGCEHGELKLSLSSLHQFAPWIRTIWVLANPHDVEAAPKWLRTTLAQLPPTAQEEPPSSSTTSKNSTRRTAVRLLDRCRLCTQHRVMRKQCVMVAG